MSQAIHPEFFPDSGLWEIQDPPLQAPTLRELRRLLNYRKLEGYYPNGFKTPAWPEADKTISTRRALPPSIHPLPFYNPSGPRGPVIKSHEKILDLWYTGHPTSEIAYRCGGLSRGVVSGVVTRARKRGDVRAGKRGRGGVR